MVAPATTEEWKKMYEACRNKRNKLRNRLILCLLYCSLRVGDMLRIRIENILWEQNEILVAVKTTHRRIGRDKKTGGRKQVPVVIDDHTKELLADYIKAMKLRGPGLLFSITPQRVWQIIKELAREASLQRISFLSPHKLRHAFAVDILQGRHSLFSGKAELPHVQDQMGHADIRYTSTYCKFTTEDRKEAFGVE